MFWRVSYREARAIALILAVVLWTLAAVFLFARPGHRSIAGPLKGGDFVFFYALGEAARSGDPARLYDVDYLHGLQTSVLPESAPELYLPVYPPRRTRVRAADVAVVHAGRGAVDARHHRRVRGRGRGGLARVARCVAGRCLRRDRRGRVPAVLESRSSRAQHDRAAARVLPRLAGAVRQHRFLAGLALGLLFFKPQFGLVLAVLVICGREWSMLGGLAVAAAVQVAAIVSLFDVSVLLDYVRFMRAVTPVEYLIEPKPFELHSMRALTRFAPAWIGTVLWLAASAVVVERAVARVAADRRRGRAHGRARARHGAREPAPPRLRRDASWR